MIDPKIPLVLLHAFPLSAAMWEPQRDAFGTRPVLIPNFPGFGGRPPSASDLESFGRTVLDDMDAAGIQEAVFLGLSMGGYVSFRILGEAPERVAGLVLADTRSGADDQAARAKRTEQAARVRREGVGWLMEALIPALLGPTTLRERRGVEAAVRRMFEGAEPEGVARALEAMRDRPDSTPLLRETFVPTLVLVGEEDTLTPLEDGRSMASAIPDARLHIIPGAGHLSNLEAPGAFNAALETFLA